MGWWDSQPDPLMGWWDSACVSHPGVLGSIPSGGTLFNPCHTYSQTHTHTLSLSLFLSLSLSLSLSPPLYCKTSSPAGTAFIAEGLEGGRLEATAAVRASFEGRPLGSTLLTWRRSRTSSPAVPKAFSLSLSLLRENCIDSSGVRT